ncbi:Uncharacterised protein [Mycobacteroides abscessus subsp. abscessus]|nr:Uncharacterised protein [Mycobacteroides abscessus subsp. abscessus]
MGAVSWVQGMPGRASPAQISSTGSPSTYTQSAPPPMRPTYIDANLRTTRSNSSSRTVIDSLPLAANCGQYRATGAS